MQRLCILSVLVFSIGACGPPLVWGGDDATKARLLAIVPLGTTVAGVEAEAKSRNWRISNRDNRRFPLGEPHYFGRGCSHQGGVSRTIIVAEYGLLTTSVETVWLFDEGGKLGYLCVDRTTDAP